MGPSNYFCRPHMATILHLDTSGPTGVAMLARDGRPVASRHSEGERDHAGTINRLVDKVLQEGGTALTAIDAVAVCNGPGSYTGLRIGLATAKGYCFAMDRPLILHSRLFLMLEEAASLLKLKKNVIAVLPARTGEYYAAGSGHALHFSPTHITSGSLEQMVVQTSESIHIIGQVEAELLAVISLKGITLSEHHMPDKYTWAQCANESFLSRKFADMAYSEPEYLKPAYVTKARGDSRNL